jgi:DNA-binding CsgD family transcriptional regulator
MLKTIFLYGLLLGILVFILHFIEYFFWVRMHIFEIYAGLIACLFLGIGLWFGKTFRQDNNTVSITDTVEIEFANLGISKREFDVLLLLNKGHSNQEIADKLFVSTNTIKTHTSRIFEKLAVKNRTQAIIKAKEKGLILP